MSFLSNLFRSSPSKTRQLPTMSPEQSGLQNLLLNQIFQSIQPQGTYGAGSSFLSQLLQGGDEAFEKFEAPIMRQFKEKILPAIAERFSSTGSKSSSAFQNALGSAGADLSERLASLRGGMQLQAAPQALNYATAFAPAAFQNRFGYQSFPGQQSGIAALLQALAPGIGQGLGLGLGSKFF